MPLETIIILVAVVGLLFLLVVGAIVLIWWRRSVRSQVAQEATVTRKKRVQKRSPQETTPPQVEMEQVSSATPDGTAPASPAVEAPPAPTPSPTPIPVADLPAVDGQSEDRIRILVVDDNPDTRDNVSRLLYFENDLEVIGQAINGRQGIEMAIELKPHIVLMDINMPDMDGITATQKMSVDAPYSQVIIMSVQAEQDYMKRAMAAGARDFQPKPFTAEELVNCVRRVYGIGRPIYRKIEATKQVQAQMTTQPQAKGEQAETDTPVIVVYSAKGGIGTSAIAANLAVALQQMQGDVVLVDADLQFGDISVHLNTRPTRTISDLVHEGEIDIELLPEVVLSHNSGMKLLLAPSQPQMADTITPAMIPPIIKGLKQQFKVVVVDTTSQLTDVTLNVLECADYIFVVTAPELPAIKSAKLFLELANQLEFTPNQLGVVVNRAHQPGGVRPDQIGKVLKLQHTHLVPYDSRIYMAMYKGVLINQQEPGAPSAQAIAQLATEVWQKLTEIEEEPAPVNAVA